MVRREDKQVILPLGLVSLYDIDHCLPYARWPNNDLWNLLLTSQTVNRQKSDKIASSVRLMKARENINPWWQSAWLDNASLQQRFFAEAGISLPGIRRFESDLDDMFEALSSQHIRVREMQQLAVWGWCSNFLF